MLLYGLSPGFYTRSSNANATGSFYQCQPTGQFSVRPTPQGRDVVVGLTLEQTQSRLCCALFVCSRSLPWPRSGTLRSYDASGLNSSSLSRQPFQPRSCLAAASAELKCSCVRISSVPFSKSRNLRVTNVSLP